jgi:hypothetical protein
MDWDWISRFRTSRKAEPADPADETVINGVPYDAQKGIRSSPENLSAPGDRTEAIAEEIKRRQISAVVRYVATVRAR